MKNISVIGAGYVGLVTAACFANFGHKVSLIEIDPERVDGLTRGVLPVTEPGLSELWQDNWAAGRLRVTSDYEEGLKDAQFAFIAVGTPSTSNGKPDLKWVRLAARSIAQAASGTLIVVVKSTVPVGTADLVSGILSDSSHNGARFHIVSNPEFLREGLAVFDFMHPTRVVVGYSDKDAGQAVAELYAPIDSPLIECDCRAAELSKYASNVFLATRISFINEIALLCDAYGVDVRAVAKVAGMEPRCGDGYLGAGLGWGGSCLPKDVRGLIYMAKNRGVPVPIVRAVQRINQRQPRLAIAKLRGLLGDLEGKTIGLLGLSFKPNSDDMREASSITIVSMLLKQGCRVKAYDPLAMERAAKLMPEIACCSDAYEVARGSDALILVTDWDEFEGLDMKKMASLMKSPIMVDGRNLYDPEKISRDFIYEGIGRHGKWSKKLEMALAGDRSG